MKKQFARFKKWITNFYKSIEPGPIAVKGAALAIGSTTLIIWLIASSLFLVIAPKTWFGVIPMIVLPLLALLLGALTVLALKLLSKFPRPLAWVIPGSILLLSFVFGQGDLNWKFPLFVFVFAGGAGAAIYTLTKKSRNDNTLKQKVIAIAGALIGVAGLTWGIIWVLDTGFEPDPELNNANLAATFRPELIELPNPGLKGDHEVAYMTYGSGTDKHRPEFGEEVNFKTATVDGSRLIDNWEGMSGKLRTWYWGFESDSLPINARVWYPKGEGPFPLALIVHGNHGMTDYSDVGYAYLGELLASHGIIMASVDENFINSGWTDMLSDGLNEENDARGWLLLKHLQVWREWNQTADHPFYQQVDMENIALMGHSRGGEAAAIAGFFNTLAYYPDDAKESFDFGFNIKAVVAIAPVDGQYKPAEVGTPLNDVNYLVIHGSNDGDVQSFSGLRQYERLNLSDSSDFFKSAVYVYGANHGQFNTSWGNKDSPQPWASLLNLDALMPMEDQLLIGKVFINGFLLSTLKGEDDYRHLFKDYRSGLDWLPETIYLNQYEDATWQTIADFDEDLDLTTAGDEAEISGHHLTVWREQLVSMKWGNRGTRAVYLGWDSTAHPIDTARYQIAFHTPRNLTNHPFLTFEMAQSKESTYPDKERDERKKEEENGSNESDEDETDNATSEDEENDEDEDDEDEDKPKAPKPINLSVVLHDVNGHTVKFSLDRYALLQPQLSVDIYKNKSLQSNKTSEAVYQTFFFDLYEITKNHQDFDAKALSKLEFVFDQEQKGVVILDKLAFHTY